MGQIEAVLSTSTAIAAANPDLTIMVGLAGSMSPDVVGLGDVVVSNQVKFFASDKVATFANADGSRSEYRIPSDPPVTGKDVLVDPRDKFLAGSFLRYQRSYVESLPCDAILTAVESQLRDGPLAQLDRSALPKRVQELRSSARDRLVHSGWILGGHNVVDSAEYRNYLVDKNTDFAFDIHRQKGEPERALWKPGELLAVDMESYGLLRAVETARGTPAFLGGCQNLIGGLTVRGISDLCEDKSLLDRDTKLAVRKAAVENATEISLRLIEALDYRVLLKG